MRYALALAALISAVACGGTEGQTCAEYAAGDPLLDAAWVAGCEDRTQACPTAWHDERSPLAPVSADEVVCDEPADRPAVL